jgi:hypothetical protein
LPNKKGNKLENTKIEFELTNDCICVEYDEETGDSKLDEQGNPIPSIVCFDCYDEERAYFQDQIVADWIKANGWELDTPLIIKGSRMTWASRSGWATATPETLADKLSINGDYTLSFTLSPDHKQLTCVRSSHDEYGAFFEFEQAPAESEVE